MKVAVQETKEIAAEAPVQVHPLKRSYMFISSKHVDYDKLSAFEASSIAAVFVLAIAVGVLTQSKIIA